MLTILRRTRRDLGAKELGQVYDQPEQVMPRMKNYSTRPSALPFLKSIPKIPWAVLWASNAVHEVHPSATAVPADQRIGSLVTSLKNFNGEALTIKEEGDSKPDGAGVQSSLWNRLLIYVYPLVLPHKVKISLEGLRMLCLRWWKSKVIYGMLSG